MIYHETEKFVKKFGDQRHQEIFVEIKNHLGCCYRRLGDLQEAKRHLKEALKYAKSNRGLTLLNLCAIYSQLGK